MRCMPRGIPPAHLVLCPATGAAAGHICAGTRRCGVRLRRRRDAGAFRVLCGYSECPAHVSSGTLRRCTQGTLCEYSEYPTHVGAGTLLLVGMDDIMDSGETPILYEYAAPNPPVPT
jgi:hypothetical protein